MIINLLLLLTFYLQYSLHVSLPQVDDYFQIRRLYTILGSSIFYKVSQKHIVQNTTEPIQNTTERIQANT